MPKKCSPKKPVDFSACACFGRFFGVTAGWWLIFSGLALALR